MPLHTDRAYEKQLGQLRTAVLEMGGLVEEQPAARDLRLITTALKITTDLERIGDIATHIAERAIELAAELPIKPYIDIPRMADVARDLLRRSLDAFVREDTELALSVCIGDDTIDQLHEQLFRELLSYMVENPATVSRAMRLLFVSKHLERVGDHATNIAETVYYMVEGRPITDQRPKGDTTSFPAGVLQK
jgi:phosphate transport system protein